MSNQVLIVASDAAARAPAEVAASLSFTPVITASEQEALDLLDRQTFSLIAVSGGDGWQRVRDEAERKQPAARVLELPDGNGDDGAVRRLMIRYLDRRSRPQHFNSEERYRFLSSILESFTATLELKEVLRRIVTITRQEFGADRAWLLHPVNEKADVANVRFSVSSPDFVIAPDASVSSLSLKNSANLIRRLLEADSPVTVREGDPDLDTDHASRFQVRSEMIQVLRPRDDEPWAFGLHQCSAAREWTDEEVSLFAEIGRYATLALNNTLLHERAVREMAKVTAILDQIPESAAIYDSKGQLERMNAAAQREPVSLFASDPEGRLRKNRHRYIDGSPLEANDLPSIRALRGDVVKSDYLVHDARSGDDRVVNLKAAPIRDDKNHIIGSVVLSRDVTDERQTAEREAWRRRRAECLANLGVDTVTVQPSFEELDDPARRVADAVGGTAMIFLYHSPSSELHMVGMASVAPVAKEVQRFREYLSHNPYHAGEGIPGTVFQIGRPLLYSEFGGKAAADFARDADEGGIISAMNEQTLIATPIESYGDRIGALVIARSDTRRSFDAEDLEFAQAVAERIGAASHIHRLTRISQEGHRAAEELARREVDARVRFEAVIETAPIGVAVFSADELRFELANARFVDYVERLGKISPDTRLIGLRVDEVIPSLEKPLKQVAESGEMRFDEAFKAETRPTPTYINRIVSAVRGRFSGITQSLTVLIQDVTDQVNARREIEDLAQAMAERSARLDSILSSMTDGLWVYDASGQVVSVNEAAITLFGFGSRTEAVEHGSFATVNLRYPDGRGIPSDDLPHARALRGMTVPDYLAIGRHFITGKDLDLSIAVAPIESNGIVGAVLVIRDITALQELDRKKDEFLSVASHELRTPLTTIKGYTQLLAQTINDLPPEERGTYLTAVLGEVDRMMGLISELLDVSRIETNRLQIDRQPISWREFIDRRANAFRIQNPARTIRCAADVPETTLHVDPDRMRQVVDNLISNAIKYSADGTDIDIVAQIDGNHMLTAVIDHGIGIPTDEISKLFERFHRARNVSSRYYGGLGLGLYIAKAIVEAHNGSISVVSEEGQGATFTIRLPLP
ncbi:MAG TPA: ATP-binding protein [Thermoanaerobaculia bacterium]|jgi:PAS domain S-box-containing protein|nr:ATP-binding protein [Thermoanaerobaculia bacterium]